MASSSRAGRARKRAAGQTAPGQDPVIIETPIIQIAEDDPNLRKIEYSSSDNFIPDQLMNRAVNHPILKFEEDTYEWDKFKKFKKMALLQHRVINWEWLTEIGAEQEVRELLGERLIDVMNCIDPQYVELVLEFHSTWMHKEGKFEQGNALSFSFGRKVYEMNVPRFAIISGLYTEDEVRRPEFSTCLRGAYSENRKYSVGKRELKAFWESISDTEFGQTNLISTVRNPIYRYVLRLLATTLVGRKSGENKANWIELFILMCRVQRREFNLATVLVDSISRGRRGGDRARLDMGPYITSIASHLGVLDVYQPQFLHRGPTTAIFGLEDLQKAGIASWEAPYGWEPIREGPPVQPPQRGPVDVEPQQEVGPSGAQQPPQTPVQPVHQAERRVPLPVPLTLESFSGYVEQRFDRLERMIELLHRGRGAQTGSGSTCHVYEASSHETDSG
ncbi:hypothetical protein HanXRQr2_Chr13g0614571 [Helianthus annuus]|uniref:Uncharacterized protein n=1 Tax=Helianthus annuus TaxID=4232 RepID=A0A9K3HEE2_HELAN|nr:hypothetical protein HanXRQr2_Chr13g0614571 [Helianthus annuus]